MEDDEIERLAREEILAEAKRAAERAAYVGPQGWMKCTILPANKRFLRNTLMQTMGKNSRVAGCSRDKESKKATESEKATTSRTDVAKSSSSKTTTTATRTDAEKSSNSRSVSEGHLRKRLKTDDDDDSSGSKRKIEENRYRKIKEADKRILDKRTLFL